MCVLMSPVVRYPLKYSNQHPSLAVTKKQVNNFTKLERASWAMLPAEGRGLWKLKRWKIHILNHQELWDCLTANYVRWPSTLAIIIWWLPGWGGRTLWWVWVESQHIMEDSGGGTQESKTRRNCYTVLCRSVVQDTAVVGVSYKYQCGLCTYKLSRCG